MTATPALRVTGPNYLGAVFSFLRVLATNAATALLPLFLIGGENAEDYPTGKALSIAVIASALLTVINYARPGETRFGSTRPNVVRGDGSDDLGSHADDLGRGTLGTIGAVLAVVGAVLLLLHLLGAFLTSLTAAVVVLLVGLILIVLDR